jgi:8-oxo-dGTP pyrophosphatase MutT (NUDIX family)
MRRIKSCGFLAFTEVDGENQYLIIKSHNGDVGFPKGHVEAGESETDTAVRELKEEAGVEVEILDGFRRIIEYKLPKTKDTIKETVYFLGRCIDPEALLRQESEVTEARFLPFKDALKVLTFEETRGILKEAQSFILERRKA